MFSLFALLFKASYWRMVFRLDTWREAWPSIKRAHKDPRARKHLRHLALMALTPFLCLAYLAFVIGNRLIFLIVPVFLAVGLWRYFRREPPEKPAHRLFTAEEQNGFREYFADVALIYAVMLDRSGSENYLRNKVLPEGFEVTTRRVHLDLLRSGGVWEKMDQRDREALIAPDGEWSPIWIDHIVMGLEPLRLLRWMLRIDFYLPAIGKQMHLDYRMAGEIVRAPQKLREGKELATLGMLEIARRSAEQYYNRCIAEKISRGLAEPKDEKSAEIAQQVVTDFSGKQHEDFVLGDKLVSEVSPEQLEWATQLSRRRVGFFHWTMLAIERGTPPEPPYKFQP